MIYLFSDGFQDQFGGVKGKKNKYKKLENHLQELSSKKLNQQHDILEKLHKDWKDYLEQLDDICLMGIRV